MISMSLFALVGLAVAIYTHLNLPRFTATRTGVLITRSVLLVVGAALGYVSASMYTDGTLRGLAFIAGFSVVHVPPALVLLLKRARRSPKS
jgi:hypothetical protein